jgi:hypothetical protein
MLKDIIRRISVKHGIYPNDAASRSFLVFEINDAAERLYRQCTLVNSMDEVVLNVSTADNLVTLPAFVGKVRSVRHATTRDKITLLDTPERYHESGRTSTDEITFKMARPRALAASITNATKLTLEFPIALASPVDVTISGSTANSSSVTEVVSITQVAETVNTFETVTSITKSATTDYDLTIKDANSNELAVVPNTALNSVYNTIMVFEPDTVVPADQDYYAVEVLYKKAYTPMVNDNDSFICGDLYDEAIYWEYAKTHYANAKDPDGMKTSTVMVNQLITDIARDNEQGLKKTYDAAPNRYLKIHSLVTNNYLTHGYRSS